MKRAVALLTLALAGCGSADEVPLAAEPADSPPLTAAPAGVVTPLGVEPEGLIADPATGIVAAGVSEPPSLHLVRATDGRLLKTVGRPARARHLSLVASGGPVLVPAEAADELVQVTLPDGNAVRTAVGSHPHDAAFARGETFISDEFAGTVSVVRGRRLVATADTGGQPGGIAAEGTRVAMVDVRRRMLVILAAPGGRVVARIPAGRGPTHADTDSKGILYVVDTQGDAILRYSLEPKSRLLGSTSVPGTPYGMAIDRRHGRLWVTQTALNRVVELQVTDDRLRVVRSFPTVRQPNSVAVDPRRGLVFVSGNAAGVLQRIDVGVAR